MTAEQVATACAVAMVVVQCCLLEHLHRRTRVRVTVAYEMLHLCQRLRRPLTLLLSVNALRSSVQHLSVDESERKTDDASQSDGEPRREEGCSVLSRNIKQPACNENVNEMVRYVMVLPFDV